MMIENCDCVVLASSLQQNRVQVTMSGLKTNWVLCLIRYQNAKIELLDVGLKKDVTSRQSCHGNNYFLLHLGISETVALAL